MNSEFDKLYADNKNVASVLSNHTRMLKLISDSSAQILKATIKKNTLQEFEQHHRTIRGMCRIL